MGRAVNPLALAFGGSNPPLPKNSQQIGLRSLTNAGVAQLARAVAFQAIGRGFESRLPLVETRIGNALVAQAAERILGKDEVISSNLIEGLSVF
jgi:hypothetical protein